MSLGWQRINGALSAMLRSRLFKPLVFAACAVPAVLLGHDLYQFFSGTNPDVLGPDPNTAVMHKTGEVALILLLITLSITPLRRLLGLNGLQKVRRMLGVWSFAYAFLHLSGYLVFEQLCYSWETCRFGEIGGDIAKRRFILAGMTAFTILLLLALTSTSGWVRRLKKNWQRLHRLVYVAALAAIVHFVWIQKSDYREPAKYAAVLAILLGVRVFFTIQKRRTAVRASSSPAGRAKQTAPSAGPAAP